MMLSSEMTAAPAAPNGAAESSALPHLLFPPVTRIRADLEYPLLGLPAGTLWPEMSVPNAAEIRIDPEGVTLPPDAPSGAAESSARDAHLKSGSERQDGPGPSLSDIILDEEFRYLVPPPTPEERRRMIDRMGTEDGPEPLMVWRRGRHRILLIGYELFDMIKLHGVSVAVREKEFETREQALLFVAWEQLARPNLSELEIMYLLGLCYQDEKQQAGGDRRSVKARLLVRGRTASALAEKFCEFPAKVRRAGKVAAAVKRIAALHGLAVIPLLFARKARLSPQAVLDLAALDAELLRTQIGRLRIEGKLPRSWQRDCPCLRGRKNERFSLPRDPVRIAEILVQKLGAAEAAVVGEGLRSLVTGV